jgi:imidazolonepropionase
MTLAMSLGSRIFGLTAEETLAAATRGAARALGRQDRVGSIQPGYQADVSVFDVPGYEEIPYRLGDVPVRCVVKRGAIVFQAPGSGQPEKGDGSDE